MPAARSPTYAPALLVTNSSDQGLLTAYCTSVLFLNQPHPMQCAFPSCLSGLLGCFLKPFVPCHPVSPTCPALYCRQNCTSLSSTLLVLPTSKETINPNAF